MLHCSASNPTGCTLISVLRLHCVCPLRRTRRAGVGSCADIRRRDKQDDNLANLLQGAQDIAGLAADLPDT
jgi:hypothetical protein